MGSSTCHYTKLNFCLKIKDQIICDYSHDILTSKQDPSLIDNNDNKLLKINISDPAITIINDESDYKIVILQNKQKNILNALYNIFNKNNDVSDKNEVIVSYINGEKYIGEWASIKNQKEGRGIKMFKNNYIYYGYWENDKMNGEGKLIKFKQKINDINIIFNDNTTPFYYGTWKNNFQDGYGKETWHDNSFYEGEYKNGYKDGKGKLILADGTEYEGEFSHGHIQGNGKIKYKDGRTYEGSWTFNKMNGEGKFTWPDGRSYKGTYLNNFKNGYGEFTWPNGKIYKGMWTKGKQNGNGKLYISESNVWIQGVWKDGKRIKK